MSSFTLCWLSLLDGLLGFKGFIGKVDDNPPFLLWGLDYSTRFCVEGIANLLYYII